MTSDLNMLMPFVPSTLSSSILTALLPSVPSTPMPTVLSSLAASISILPALTLAGAEAALVASQPWWDERTANLLGGLAGGGVGVLGALLGSVGSYCANRGKARGAVLGTQLALAVLGIVLCLVGGVAWVLGQPFHVGYPLGLSGFILAAVMGGLYPVMRTRYRDAEQRKLAAAELRRA